MMEVAGTGEGRHEESAWWAVEIIGQLVNVSFVLSNEPVVLASNREL